MDGAINMSRVMDIHSRASDSRIRELTLANFKLRARVIELEEFLRASAREKENLQEQLRDLEQKYWGQS